MTEENRTLKEYREHIKEKKLLIVVSAILILVTAVLSISVGPSDISISKVVSTLLDGSTKGSSITSGVIWYIRLPRVLAAIVAGAGLSLSGAVLQSVLRNPLGSPYTLGISQAAAFGAAISIVFLGAGKLESGATVGVILNNPYIITISAFACSLVSTFVIFLMVKYKGASPATMVLAGIALGSLFGAGMTSVQYFASETELASIIFWTFGDLSRVVWRDLGILTAVMVPVLAYFVLNSWNYNVLDSGDEAAKSLGIEVDKLRLSGLVLSSLLAAVVVSFFGIIGFVGLVVPHIIRRIIGGDERFLIPASCLVGGLLLLVSDTLARTIIAPIVLPVGILTSFLGAPLFIYLLIRGRRYW